MLLALLSIGFESLGLAKMSMHEASLSIDGNPLGLDASETEGIYFVGWLRQWRGSIE